MSAFIVLVKNSSYNIQLQGIGCTKGKILKICKTPIRFVKEEYKNALDIEFNMTYPNGFKHNKHSRLVNVILNIL